MLNESQGVGALQHDRSNPKISPYTYHGESNMNNPSNNNNNNSKSGRISVFPSCQDAELPPRFPHHTALPALGSTPISPLPSFFRPHLFLPAAFGS